MDTSLLITFWLMSGAFTGGVVTPIVAANRRIGEWGTMLLGLVVGAVGNIFLLVPLWLGLSRLPRRATTGPAWQQDTVSLAELRAGVTVQPDTGDQESVLGFLKANFWPTSREHSHRMAYVGVFFALAVITLIEVVLSTWDGIGFDVVGPLVALSTAKVILVVMFFMHLRYDHPWYSWIFASALPFAGIVLLVLSVV
ncbi:MAG: cytochrome C oxidase subunit IV family protein [Anaerolineae bacterium]|nr:cytochrome C oxidase subunit IV family protein [Anaerolineae bacterium]